jgi:hypothetical protein
MCYAFISCRLWSSPTGRWVGDVHHPRLPSACSANRGISMPVVVNRAPVLTLWATIVAEKLGHPADTALTLGRAVAGSAARTKASSIGREQSRTDRDADTPRLHQEHVTAPVFLLGKEIRLLPTEEGELRAAGGDKPANSDDVRRYLEKAFGDYLIEVQQAMEMLAVRYDPQELNRIGFRLYEQFRPEVPHGSEGWGAKAALEVERILAARYIP